MAQHDPEIEAPVMPKIVTWNEKLKKGKPLNAFDETKADADFNYRARLREEKERKAFEALKAAGKLNAAYDTEDDFSEDDADEDEEVLSTDLSRSDLNQRALAVGVENPDQLPNKQAVVDAINEKGAN